MHVLHVMVQENPTVQYQVVLVILVVVVVLVATAIITAKLLHLVVNDKDTNPVAMFQLHVHNVVVDVVDSKVPALAF